MSSTASLSRKEVLHPPTPPFHTTAAHGNALLSGFELEFGTLKHFFGGLESAGGSPSPRVREGMAAEHTGRDDADVEFCVDNYNITTTSRIEWYFVADPGGGLTACDIESFPPERSPLPPGAAPRQPLPLDAFRGDVEAHNSQLRMQGQPELIQEEILAARLYTGPMYAAGLHLYTFASPYVRHHRTFENGSA